MPPISRIFKMIQDFQDFLFRPAFYSLSGGLRIPGSVRFHQFPFGNVLQIGRTPKISRFSSFPKIIIIPYFYNGFQGFEVLPFQDFQGFQECQMHLFQDFKILRFQDWSRCRFEPGFVRVVQFARFSRFCRNLSGTSRFPRSSLFQGVHLDSVC